jgi:FKBP-type peptidyl-prolyl cis-trans isomerase
VRRLLSLLVPVLVVLLGVAGCGSDDPDDSDATSEALPGVTVSGPLGEEPTVEIDAPYETDKTTTEVVEEGDGDELEEGDTALVQYIGLNGRTGDEFNNSWSQGGEPVPFPLTEGSLITGFLDGLIGQQVGSRVAIGIPPEDGYGPQGGNPDIDVEKDDSLVFVVDIVDTALDQAEGEAQTLPDDVPQLQTDDEDVPTGFTATDATAPPPKEATAEVAIIGTGEEVKEGQTISFKYLVQVYPDGKVLDDSYSRGQAARAVSGSGQPPCWDALVGQTVGSRVVLACPPGTVFGPEGNKDVGVGPDDTLLFAIDLLTAG